MQGPGVYRYRLGSYEITALYDGTWFLPIERDFVRNAGRAEVNAALGRAFLPPNVLPVSFTALLVNTGKKLVLIDTGTAGQVADTAGVMLDNLMAAGVKPADVDTILISHFHPDHIDGIKSKDNAKVFPNAEILVPEGEWAFWMDDGNMARADAKSPVHRYFLNARRIFGDIAKEVRPFKPGTQVAPGIEAVAAFGHTPGHTAFAIHSGAQSMLAMSDTVREPGCSCAIPAGSRATTWTGRWRRRRARACSSARPPSACWSRPITSPSRPAATSSETAAGYALAPVMWAPLVARCCYIFDSLAMLMALA